MLRQAPNAIDLVSPLGVHPSAHYELVIKRVTVETVPKMLLVDFLPFHEGEHYRLWLV